VVPLPDTLPLFPLPMVLFPGTSAPLHIFEPRYRRMLADCLNGDRRFGLISLPAGTSERELPGGRVGTVAHIESADALPDGRSNIAVSGEERFAFEHYVDADTAYHVAKISGYDDVPEPAAELEDAAQRLREQFARVARAARTLSDDAAPTPPLPDDPSAVAFGVAAMIDLTTEQRQRLLESRSPLARTRECLALLELAAEPLERRAETHARAKHNGRGPIEAA
jgi:Lon protease-like protein